MRLYTFIVSSKDIFNEKIVLKEDINHLKNVLRLKVDDLIRVVDGSKEYFCEIESIDKTQVLLNIEKYNSDEKIDKNVTAAISLIKSQNFSTIVKEFTEIGIDNLIPIYTKRTTVSDFNLEKWNKISKEALKQCRGIKFMNIYSPTHIQDIDFSLYDLKVLAYEKECNYTLWDLLKDYKPKNSIFFVGPEGGFEEEEVNFLKSKGFFTISLGKRILRVETASILMGGSLINGF